MWSVDRDVLSKRASTVDPNILAGDEIRTRPEQIEERTDQVVGRFLAVDAALRGQHLLHLGLAVIVVAVECDVIWGKRVDADPVWSELARQCPRQADDRC